MSENDFDSKLTCRPSLLCMQWDTKDDLKSFTLIQSLTVTHRLPVLIILVWHSMEKVASWQFPLVWEDFNGH